MSLEDAALACGIPLEEAQERALKRLQNEDETACELRALAYETMRVSVAKLTEITNAGPRFSETHYDEETGKPLRSVTPQNVDLDAARELSRLATAMLKLSGAGRAAPEKPGKGAKLSVQLDLWDTPGNWNLKKPE